jgi:uncharacterized repeat protein (TIGR03899 family)
MNNDNKTIINVPKNDISSLEISDSGAAPNIKGNISSQKQLLLLAKKFSIEGALLPTDKQMPLEDRTAKRIRSVQCIKQENLESILKKSLAYFNEESISDKIDQDWFNSFLALAEDVSNNTMQGLWAKILSGEVAQPGSFSLKALQVFRSMSIYDAKLFAKACALACNSQKNNYRILSGCYQKPSLFNIFSRQRQQVINLNQFSLSFNEILLLADNALLFKQESETGLLEKGSSLAFNFNGLPLNISVRTSNCVINFYKFTPVGTELAKLIADTPNKEYFQILKNKLSALFQL